ncbi:MAG: hypothetical protein HXY20_05015 [Acidobacteria bacterium]|nr:hypothetical protein [Acidobacteriota bacterium]
MDHRGIRLYKAACAGPPVYLLGLGVGPRRAENSLARALRVAHPSAILLIGYAGALDPGIRLGEVLAVRPASLLAKTGPERNPKALVCEGTWDLPFTDAVADSASSAGIHLMTAPGLTAHGVVGDPLFKSLLLNRFGAALIDMETAAVARVAQEARVPAACVRAITDTADDDFLKPLSFQSEGGRLRAHLSSLIRGELLEHRREWNRRTAAAGAGLCRFLSSYLGAGPLK